MIGILREFIVTKKEMLETSNELSKTKELLNFSLDEEDRLKEEIEKQKAEYENLLKEILKVIERNNYNNTNLKPRMNKIKELILDHTKTSSR